MMKGALCMLALCLPALTLGSYIDNYCGDHPYISYTRTFYVSGALSTDCVVHFENQNSGKLSLQISGSSIDCSTCKVKVNGYQDGTSKTYGYICSYGESYDRTVYSNNMGSLYVHVQGDCSTSGLSFEVKPSCPSYQFQCDDGDCVYESDRCDGYSDCDDGSDEYGCFWSVGAYVGVSIGSFIFFCVMITVLGVFYRRRTVLVRRPVLVASGNTIVTQSRW